MAETNYVKKDTFEKMREELHLMKSVDRPAASKAIGEAREKGDLKEIIEFLEPSNNKNLFYYIFEYFSLENY